MTYRQRQEKLDRTKKYNLKMLQALIKKEQKAILQRDKAGYSIEGNIAQIEFALKELKRSL